MRGEREVEFLLVNFEFCSAAVAGRDLWCIFGDGEILMERARDDHGACMGLREVDWARGTRGWTSGIAVVCVGRVGVLLIAGAIG